ncbi:MAG: DUF5678 domain-containing protein [Desulfobacterales bacterium]|nr:DUF5678 domain-containing protein [Desulfobacterales bacterium]
MTGSLVRASTIPGTTIEKLIESVTISGYPPEKILKQFNTYGIEWHLTEKGDLLIKSWCIGAENFVPVEHVMRLREVGEKHGEANALEWVSKHLSELRREYPGKWIAVVDDQVTAASDSLIALMQQLHDQGIERPFITEIPSRPVVWATTYVYKGI